MALEFVFEAEDIIGGQEQIKLAATLVEARDIRMTGKTKFFLVVQGTAMFGKVMIVHVFRA